MRLTIVTAVLFIVSALTTLAWAVGLDAAMLRAMPWREIVLVALPTLSITGLRLRRYL